VVGCVDGSRGEVPGEKKTCDKEMIMMMVIIIVFQGLGLLTCSGSEFIF
jgi:hypothetical protein